jgi:hypothetical protein
LFSVHLCTFGIFLYSWSVSYLSQLSTTEDHSVLYPGRFGHHETLLKAWKWQWILTTQQP